MTQSVSVIIMGSTAFWVILYQYMFLSPLFFSYSIIPSFSSTVYNIQ